MKELLGSCDLQQRDAGEADCSLTGGRIRGAKAPTSLACLSLVSFHCSPLAKLKQMTKDEESPLILSMQMTIWGKSRLKGEVRFGGRNRSSSAYPIKATHKRESTEHVPKQ